MNISSTFFIPRALSTANGDVLPAMCLKQMMMKRIACLLFFCYALMLIRPGVPVFADMLAHTFFEQQHLMTVHEEHGKFHIHYEVQKQLPENNGKGKPVENTSYSEDHCLCERSIMITHAKSVYHTNPIFAIYKCYYPISYRDKHDLPPKV